MAWFEKGIIYCSNRVLKLFAALEEAQVRVKGKKTCFLKVKKACFEGKRLGLREGCINKVLKLFGALEEAQVRLKGKEACFEGKMHLFRRARPVAKAVGGGGS